MEISNNNLAIGAGVGTAVGAGAGLAVGAKQAGKLLQAAGIKVEDTVDTFKNSKIKEVMKTKSYRNANVHNRVKAKEAVIENAKALFETVKTQAKNTKIKWAAGLAAAGLAIGAGVALIVSKANVQKAEASEMLTEKV